MTREMDVRPLHVIAFETYPGDGCEPANFGLCRFPSEISHPEFGKIKTKLKGWSWHSFCKTHYASDPRCGGLPNFLRCHLGVVALLDEAKKLGFLGNVTDEGEFWETRSLDRLTKEIGEQSAMLSKRASVSPHYLHKMLFIAFHAQIRDVCPTAHTQPVGDPTQVNCGLRPQSARQFHLPFIPIAAV